MLLAVLSQRSEQNQQDVELLKRIQRRDQQALSLLYDRYSTVLFTLATRVLSSNEEAEDLLQEVFLQIWEKADTYAQDRGTVYSWTIALCRNKAIDRLRSKSHKGRSKEKTIEHTGKLASQEPAANPEQLLTLKDYSEVVSRAMKSLSSLEIKILELSYYKGYSQSEIARLLKMPLGTVKTKMRKGITKLRQVIGREGNPA